MPQLDKLTFLSQFFWLCIVYFGFYLILVKHFLPRVNRILKIRSMKMNSASGSALFEIKQENDGIQNIRDQFVPDALKESRHFFMESYQNTHSWLSKVIEDINKNQLQEMNKVYISSVSDLSIGQLLIINNLKTVIAPYSYKVSKLEIAGTKPSTELIQLKDKFFTSKLLSTLLSTSK